MARKQTATEIQVTFRHIDGAITEKTREYVQNRLRRIVGTLPNLRLATAAVTYEATGPTETKYVVQTTLTADRTVLRVEEKGSDPFSAIDRTHDPLARRIRDWKDRVYYRRRHQAAMLKEPLAVEDEMLPAEVEENESSIVRLKSHETKPMFPEDAVEQVERSGPRLLLFPERRGQPSQRSLPSEGGWLRTDRAGAERRNGRDARGRRGVVDRG